MGHVAGAYQYTAAIGNGQAASIGGTEEGFNFNREQHWQDIHDDEFGGPNGTPVDSVNLGETSSITLTGIDYTLFKPLLYAHVAAGNPKANVGKLASSVKIKIVATPVAGTPAAAEGPYTFYMCRLQGNVELLFNSGHRKGPMTFLLLPDPANSNKTFEIGTVSPPPPP